MKSLKQKTIIRPIHLLPIFTLLFSLVIISSHGQAQTNIVDLSSQFSLSTANERSVLDRRTMKITSTADVTLTNTSNQPVVTPLHGVITINNATGPVTMPEALGGPASAPYNKYYYDLTSKLSGGQLASGGRVTFNVKFVRASTVTFRYNATPYGVMPSANQAPIVDAGPAQTITLPDTATLNGTVTDDGLPSGGTLTITWSKISGPGSVTFGPPNTAVTTATFGQAGTYVLRLTANDSQLPGYGEVTVTVNPAANQAPVANAGANRTIKLSSGQTSVRVLLDGSASKDPDGTIAGYLWTGTPDPADVVSPPVDLTTGTYTFTLVVTDNKGATSQPSTVSVTVNQPPVANAGANRTIKLASGQTSVRVFLDGSASKDPDGTIAGYLWTGTPDPADVVSPPVDLTTGTYTFTLVVTDNNNAQSLPSPVIITVLPPNQLPVANAGANQTRSSLPGQTSITTQLNGTASVDPDGTIVGYSWSGSGSGTPTPAAVVRPTVSLPLGTHTFNLVVTDNHGGVSSPSPSITVQVVQAQPPVLTVPSLNYSIIQGQTLNIEVSAMDPDGDPLSLSATPVIKTSTFTTSSGTTAQGTFTFTPDSTQTGRHFVNFKARDPLGLNDTKTVQIDVNKLNQPPALTLPVSASVDEGKILTVKAEASDPNGDPVTLTTSALPANALFIAATGTLTFTPDYNQAGVYPITVTASDGQSSVSNTIQVTVKDVPTGGTGPAELVLQVDPEESPTFLSSQRVTGTVNVTGAQPPAPKMKSTLITGMIPTNGEQGQTIEVSLTGQTSGDYATHFAKNVSQATFGSGISVNSINVISATSAFVTIKIDSSAVEGSRSVSVVTGIETAVSVLAFSVTKGKSGVSGKIIDPNTKQPVTSGTVAIQGTTLSAIIQPDGSFTLLNVPSGPQTLIVNAPNHEFLTLPVDVQSNTTINLGELQSPATVFDPTAPPSVSLLSIAGRNFGDVTGNLNVEDTKKVITDALLLVGGSEAGVFDEYGNQLNPGVVGAGMISLTQEGVRLIAQKIQRGGETVSLGELLFAFSSGFQWSENKPMTLEEWLSLLQGLVNQAWWEPNKPENALPILMFNRGMNPSPDPPELSPFTRLNPAQAFLFTSSLWSYIFRAPEPSGSPRIYLAANFNVDTARDVPFPFIRLAQVGPPPQPGSGAKPFTRFWRNAFEARTNVLTTNFNAAKISYLMAVNSLGVPLSLASLTLSQAVLGTAADNMNNALRDMRIASMIPEPPMSNSITTRVTTDQVGVPNVNVTFRLSPSQLTDSNNQSFYIYSLFRYGEAGSERKLVDVKGVSLASTGVNTLSLKDTEPLPLIKDQSGQMVRTPSATWFYTLTATKLNSAENHLTAQDLINAVPWWTLPTKKLIVPGQSLLGTKQMLVSDYSAPKVVTVNASGEITVDEIAVDPQKGEVYLSDTQGGGAEKQPRFIKISEGQESNTFAYSGFKFPPGHRGLAIDKAGNLYTDNAASDEQFGGRIFKFFQPDGRREFVGNINYFSQQLMFAQPTSSGPMAIGPGAMPGVSAEDLYVVDELEGMVKRVMVNATFDPFRRVGQPFANIPIAGKNVDLELDNDGNVYLLKERIASTILSVEMIMDKTSLNINETCTVTLKVTNPGSALVKGVHVLPLVIEGLGSVYLTQLPESTTVDLGPGGTATFVFKYTAATSGSVRFAAQVEGADSGGYTISSPVVRSKAAVEIVQPKPLVVTITLPEKSKPVIKINEVLKVELTLTASAFLSRDLEEIKFQGDPLTLNRTGRLEVVSRTPADIPAEFSLKPGETKTFQYELRGIKWGTIKLSSFVTAVDAEAQTVSAVDSVQVIVHADLLKIEVKADPSGFKLEKDTNNNLIEQEVKVTVNVKNIVDEPLPVINIPGRLLLYAVYVTSTVQMNCPLRQTSPDPIGSDIVASLQPGESISRTYTFKADNDGKCDVEATATVYDPLDPENILPVGAAVRVVASKDILALDMEFEKNLYFLRKGGVGFGGEVKKKKLGEPFLIFGWIRNLSKYQKLEVKEILSTIIPGSTLSRIAKPVLILTDKEQEEFDGCGCKPEKILDPGEILIFSSTVMTVDEPVVREHGITHTDLRFQVVGEAIDEKGNRTPVVSEIVERTMPIDYDEKFLSFMQGWYRFADVALESYCMSFAFPAQLVEMLWAKDNEGNNVLSKGVYDAFAFGIEWWRDLPYNDRAALVKKMTALGGATVETTIGMVDKYNDDLGDAIGRGDWGKVAEMTGPLAGEFLAEAPEFILTCGAGMALKKAGKEAIEEGVEVAAKRLIKEKKLSIIDMVDRPPGKLKGLKAGYVLKDDVVTWMFGVGEDTAVRLRELAKKLNVNISARHRHPRSAELIKNGDAIPKPEQIKLKTVNDIDQKYLGYPNDPLDDDLATVVYKHKYDLELPGYSQNQLGDVLNLGGEKALAKIKKMENPGQFSKEEWDQILDRYATRVKEHDKYSQEMNAWDTQGRTVLKFRFKENAVDVDPVLENVGFKLKPVPDGCGPTSVPCKGKRVMIQKDGQPPKRVTGDIDYIDAREANGTPLGYKVGENGVPYIDQARREEVWRALGQMDDNAQHMDSASFRISEVKQEYINDHSLTNPDAEPLIQFGADGQARTVYIQDHMTYRSEGTQSRMIFEGGYVEKDLKGW
jgi:hypothetical protein